MKITKDNFESEVIKSNVLTLVDFWAEWCGPCAMISPVIEKIKKTYGDKIKVCKVNIDEEVELALVNKIISIPTICFYKNGEIVETVIGYHDETEFSEIINKLL